MNLGEIIRSRTLVWRKFRTRFTIPGVDHELKRGEEFPTEVGVVRVESIGSVKYLYSPEKSFTLIQLSIRLYGPFTK